MSSLYDAHCHLDFASEAESIARAAQEDGVHALCSTVIPSSFVSARMKFEETSNIRVGLGFHPWWVDENRTSEVDLVHFEDVIDIAPFIGEIGLDFSRSRRSSREKQVDSFKRIMRCVKDKGSAKPIFLHAVRSTNEVLDILEDMNIFDSNLCVFHWFSGTHEQFGRALSLGAMFSCSMRMIVSGDGELITKAIPADRLLAETDSPPHTGSDWSLDTWKQEIENTMKSISEVRGCTIPELEKIIEHNYTDLVQMMIN